MFLVFEMYKSKFSNLDLPFHFQLYNVAGVLGTTPSYEHLKYIHMMNFDNVCVTQQKTIYDCGVFVLKFLSAVDNEILWKDTKYFEVRIFYLLNQFLKILATKSYFLCGS
ncbi:hypothetical protein KSS87_008140 [Heliosperma pusillum]|nr:hypothetical protein KSS87_008140 [Heliosperma pusillum]